LPELPEIETIASGLARCLPGLSVRSAILRRDDILRRGSLKAKVLEGWLVSSVERVGKNIAIRFGSGYALVVNLGMTGRLIYKPFSAKDPRFPRSHMHAVLHLSDDSELRYYDARRFGFMYITQGGDIATELGVGKDPFEITSKELAEILASRNATVKSILLNQSVIAGLGNIYVDETLFGARIHPLTGSSEAGKYASLILSSARRILKRAIKARGTTIRDYRSIDGSSGTFQRSLKVYGRQGKECERCGSNIVKINVAGRGTHFCPNCQPLLRG